MPNFKAHRREPQITDGLRSPDQSPARLGLATLDGREPDAPEVIGGPDLDEAKLDPPDPKRTLRRFRSRNLNQMILLEAWGDDRMPDGRIVKGKTVTAKFKQGYYETTNAKHAALIEASQNFGFERDFWDADEEEHVSATAQYDAWKRDLVSKPALSARFRKEIAAGDFEDVLKMKTKES